MGESASRWAVGASVEQGEGWRYDQREGACGQWIKGQWIGGLVGREASDRRRTEGERLEHWKAGVERVPGGNIARYSSVDPVLTRPLSGVPPPTSGISPVYFGVSRLFCPVCGVVGQLCHLPEIGAPICGGRAGHASMLPGANRDAPPGREVAEFPNARPGDAGQTFERGRQWAEAVEVVAEPCAGALRGQAGRGETRSWKGLRPGAGLWLYPRSQNRRRGDFPPGSGPSCGTLARLSTVNRRRMQVLYSGQVQGVGFPLYRQIGRQRVRRHGRGAQFARRQGRIGRRRRQRRAGRLPAGNSRVGHGPFYSE